MPNGDRALVHDLSFAGPGTSPPRVEMSSDCPQASFNFCVLSIENRDEQGTDGHS